MSQALPASPFVQRNPVLLMLLPAAAMCPTR